MSEMDNNEDFKSFYREWFPRLVEQLRRTWSSKEQSEAAAQESMIKIWNKWDTRETAERIATTVAQRTMVDIWRQEKKLQTCELGDTDRAPQGGNPSTVYEVREALAAIPSLPAKQRMVMALNVQGYTREEIAEILEMKPATVGSNLCQARARLRERLDDSAMQGGKRHGTRRCPHR